MPGARGGMDAEVVDIRETEREFQADMPLLEPLDMNIVTRAKTILFRTAKELAQGNRRSAAKLECASRALPHVRFRTCWWDRGDWKVSVWNKSRNQQRSVHVQSRNGLCSGTRTAGIPHTLQRTPLKRHHDRQP